MRVVDDHRERLALVDASRTGRARRAPTRSRRAIASSAIPSSRAAATLPSTFSTLKRPRSRVAARSRRGTCAVARERRALRADVGVLGEAERDERRRRAAQLVGEPAAALVADVDRRGRRASPMNSRRLASK